VGLASAGDGNPRAQVGQGGQPELRVLISGAIATGKTTLGRLLAEDTTWIVLREDIRKYCYLPSYYREPARWAFHTSVDFLTRKAFEQLSLDHPGRVVVHDLSLDEVFYVYCHKHYDDGRISKRDIDCLARLHAVMAGATGRPDLVVFLDAPSRVLLTRIRKRGRAYEHSVSLTYLQDICQRYRRWVRSLEKTTRVLRLDTTVVNYAHDRQHAAKVLDQIHSVVASLRHPSTGSCRSAARDAQRCE